MPAMISVALEHLSELWLQFHGLARHIIVGGAGAAAAPQKRPACGPPAAGLFPAQMGPIDTALASTSAKACSTSRKPSISLTLTSSSAERKFHAAPVIDNLSEQAEYETKMINDALRSTKDYPFVCHYCDARFRIRGYLTRHIKKHALTKAYKCPFYNPSANCCHSTGQFSRRDTYKTHLYSRHVLYPPETEEYKAATAHMTNYMKLCERIKSSGNCAQCGAFAPSLSNWVEEHIESGQCPCLPENYVPVNKHERRSGKLQKIQTSNGNFRFVSTAKSVMEPHVLINSSDAREAMDMVNTNVSMDIEPTDMKLYKGKLVVDSTNFTDARARQKIKRRRESCRTSKSLRNSVLYQDPVPVYAANVCDPNSISAFEDLETRSNSFSSNCSSTESSVILAQDLPSMESLSSLQSNEDIDKLNNLNFMDDMEWIFNNCKQESQEQEGLMRLVDGNCNTDNFTVAQPELNVETKFNGFDNFLSDCMKYGEPIEIKYDYEQECVSPTTIVGSHSTAPQEMNNDSWNWDGSSLNLNDLQFSL